MPRKTKPKRNVGGAAAQSGINFQNRVAAWVAVRILSEASGGGIFGLTGIPTLLRCETEQPVDDLLVGTVASSFAFVNVKHSLTLSSAANSPLATVIDQFVRQILAFRIPMGTRPWERPLEPARDALVLLVGPITSASVRVHLQAVLDKLRMLLPIQPLTDAPTNRDEERAFRIVSELVRQSYTKETGAAPTEAELRNTLLLMRVASLNLDPGGEAEQQAKALLRDIVLADPSQADPVWATLLQFCARLAEKHGGADRATLQRELQAAGLSLNVPRSYESDLATLRQITLRTEDALSSLAKISVAGKTVRIDRAVTREIERLSSVHSVLVVGEPGAGKSGAIVRFADRLKSQGQDYVMLAVDRLTAAGDGDLRRELGLTHHLDDVLKNWVGDAPAFLIIDALDAARGGSAAQTLRHLIEDVTRTNTRWRVIASIRKFDLRYSQELREIFAVHSAKGTSSQFRDAEFDSVSHVSVSRLSDAELRDVQAQAPKLGALVSNAQNELRELLRNPFNLSLMASLLSGGVPLAELTPIRTQLELLDRYWLKRVIGSDERGDAHEQVLRQVCLAMTEMRMLHVNAARIQDTRGTLQNLKSEHVLVEWQSSLEQPPDRYVLAFSHHVLFDYAAARLLLRGAPAELVATVERTPDVTIILRPSFTMHFQHLWITAGKPAFWNLAFQLIASPGVPQIGKLAGPSVAAEIARALADFDPLLARMQSLNDQERMTADQALEHVVGSILVTSRDQRPLVGPAGQPWPELMERISRDLRISTAYGLRSLVTEACESIADCTAAQLADLGAASRRLLEFAWRTDRRDEWLVNRAIECVAKTFESNASDSAALLRRAIEPAHLRDYGFEEMPWLARQVRRLIPLDSQLVEDIYIATFGFREKSDAPTAMSPSRILRLSGNKRQDYDMARYELADRFSEFLRTQPERAARALIAAVEAHVREERSVHDADVPAAFPFGERTAHILTDYSSIWDGGLSARHEDPLRMLEMFTAHCESVANSDTGLAEFRKILNVIVERNLPAVIWARLLQLGAKFPATIGREVTPLGSAVPILTGIDTMHSAGEYLGACFSSFETREREAIERAILSIPDNVPSERKLQGEALRNVLLGGLSLESLITGEARTLLTHLIHEQGVPENKRPVHFESFSRAYGEVEYLQDQGVTVDSGANRSIRQLEEPVVAFGATHRNSSPTPEQIETALPNLRALYEAVLHANRDGVDEKQADYAAGVLTEACAAITQNPKLSCDSAAGAFVREVLLHFRNHPSPQPHPASDAQFDKSPSWGGPAARISATQGLTNLARSVSCANQELLDAVETLSKDPVPAVRFQVITRLIFLYETDASRMWRIIEQIVANDPSRGVVSATLAYPVSRLAGAHPDRAANCVKNVLERRLSGDGSDEVAGAAVGILNGLYVWQDHRQSGEILSAFIASPGENPQLLQRVILNLRGTITHGAVDGASAADNSIRRRALKVFERIIRSAKAELAALQATRQNTPFDSWSEADQERARQLARILDTAAKELYFGSGAYEAKHEGQPGKLGSPEKRRLFEESQGIVDELAELSFPGIAHNLLQTLESFVAFDARRVFLAAGRVVRSGASGGYQFEQMAADLVVRLVERYLAEYRELLQNDADCRTTLLELLDTFIRAGWSNARRLTYRLQDIYR